MQLNWETVESNFAFKVNAPLFGSIRVERYSCDCPWSVNWSVAGHTDTLIDHDFATANEAKRGAEKHIAAALAKFTQ